MKEVFCRAPSRVDFAGGTLDLPFFAEREKGATLNCAVSKYGYSSVKPNFKFPEINSLNYNQRIKVTFPVQYNRNLDLIKAAFKEVNFREKATLTTYHEMPPHSRLGTSSSISVSALAALLHYQKKKINRVKIAEIATLMERNELDMDNGPQDQYAAALGGILMLRYKGKKTSFEKVKLKKDTIYELEKNLILCSLNSKAVAGDINHETVKKYEEGDGTIISAIENIKRITFEMYLALKKGDMRSFSDLLNEETENRIKLNKYVMTPVSKRYIKIGLENGASAAKILGAGAGGTILFYAKEGQVPNLIQKLEISKGKIFNFRFDFDGLQIWEK